MKILRFWYVPVIAVLSFVLWSMRIRKGNPLDGVQTEIDVINATAEMKKIQAQQGRLIALAKIEVEYREELNALDEDQKKLAKKLRADPVRLAKFALRVARQNRRR